MNLPLSECIFRLRAASDVSDTPSENTSPLLPDRNPPLPQFQFVEDIVGDVAGKKHTVDIRIPESKWGHSYTGQVTVRWWGNGSRRCKRPSVRISLANELKLKTGEEMKELVLVSLCLDDGYLRYYSSLQFLESLDLFPAKFQLAEVLSGNRTFGMYLVLELPGHTAQRLSPQHFKILAQRSKDPRTKEGKVIIHAESNSTQYRWEKDKNDKETLKGYFNLFQIALEKKGPELLDTLRHHMDYDNYMKWMATNSLLLNGDYQDEAFFYNKKPPEGANELYFSFLAWDYDEIFSKCSRDAAEEFHDNLLFCAKSYLDVPLKDSHVRKEYLKATQYVLDKALPEKYSDILEESMAQVMLFLKHADIAEVMFKKPQDAFSIVDQTRSGLVSSFKARHAELTETLKHEKTTNQDELQIDIPQQIIANVSFPLCLRVPAQQEVSQLNASVKVGLNLRASFQLHKGRGCFRIRHSDLELGKGSNVVFATAGHWTGYRVVNVVSQPQPRTITQSEIDDAVWKEGETILLSKDLRVKGRLDILTGVAVLLGPNVSLSVSGTITAQGTQEKPIVFTSNGQHSWGKLFVDEGIAYLSHTWFLQGGNSADKASHLGHSESAPVIHISNGYLIMFGGGVTFNEGKALGPVKSRVHLFRVTITHCDTGGEYFNSRVVLQNSHVFEIPDGDSRIEDDDNDGFYLRGGYKSASGWDYASIENTVISLTEDDCVDHNGGFLEIKNTWLASALHEGVACSSGRRVVINNTVATDCKQGFEVGYGRPIVEIYSSLAKNQVGIRYGDEYSKTPKGTLLVSHSVSTDNRKHDYFNQFVLPNGTNTNPRQTFECSSIGQSPSDQTCENLPVGPNLGHLHDSLNLFINETCPSDVFEGVKLGKGSYKVAFRGRWNSQDVVFYQAKGDHKWTRRRMLAMMSLKHPNLATILGYCYHEGDPVLISEYVEGAQLLSEKRQVAPFLKSFNLTQRLNIALGISKGLAYLHYDSPLGSIYHFDFAPKNVLLTRDGQAKVNDFVDDMFRDDRIKLRKPEMLVQGNVTTCCRFYRCGTPCPSSVAPECRQCQDYTEKYEVYRLGLIFYTLLFNEDSFELPLDEVVQKLASEECPSPAFCQLTRSCLKDQEDRPTSRQVVAQLEKL